MTVSLAIKFSTNAQTMPPQPIRLVNVDWVGSADKKMEDGSEVQPWHCLPFVEGSTYGLELIYPYENECQVVGANGTIHFEWDFAKEPGGVCAGGEFRAFSPYEAVKYYSFATMMDLVPPPGYVLRTEPHPRYFTDETGTVPLAMIGHLQNEWFPRRVALAFRAPRQGQRHIFRKGEPYAQILFVHHRVKYEMTRLSDEEVAERRALDRTIDTVRFDIAENTWRNPAGVSFTNHYKVLARAFGRGGMAAVRELVEKTAESIAGSFPMNKSIPECMAEGVKRLRVNKYEQAAEIFLHVLERHPNYAAAHCNLSICFVSLGNFKDGIRAMRRASELQPASANYHINLGEQLRRAGEVKEAEASFRAALRLTPNDPDVLCLLGASLAQQGQMAAPANASRPPWPSLRDSARRCRHCKGWRWSRQADCGG
jgi:tetratricopeptide (TPR) repeat protein